MSEKLATKVWDQYGKLVDKIDHFFFPALSLNIAREHGLQIDASLIDETKERIFKAREEGDLWRWDVTYDPDYDDTIVSRMFLFDEGYKPGYHVETFLPLNIDPVTGGIFSFMNEEKPNTIFPTVRNSVCPIVNAHFRRYQKRICQAGHDVSGYLRVCAEKAARYDVTAFSRYYVSNAYLCYALYQPDLDFYVDRIISAKIHSTQNKTELGLYALCAKDADLRKKINARYARADDYPLVLFVQPIRGRGFSCDMFEEVVHILADRLTRR